MDVVGELTKLQELYKSGAVTEAEYQSAKALLLQEADKPSESRQRLAIIEQENALLRIEQDWTRERETLLVQSRNGTREPRKEDGEGFILVGIIAGALLMLFAAGSKDAMGMLVLGGFVLLLGVLQGVYYLGKASEFEKAYRSYQARRSKEQEKLQALRKARQSR